MTAPHRLSASQSDAQRIRIRSLQPLCPRCTANSKVRPGIELDHIIPLHKAKTAMELHRLQQDANVQLLCKPCHIEKTAEDFGYALKGCDADGWPTDKKHIFNKTEAKARAMLKRKKAQP